MTMMMRSLRNKNMLLLTTAVIATAACSTVDATTATLLRGGGLRQQQQQQQQQHVVVLEEEEDGIDEVGEQVQHYPPPNWDGLSTPSRRELMRNRALDASLQQHLVDESEDPNPDIAVMGRLIEDENDTGLFDWEMIVDATATTVEEKVYDPPVDAITLEGTHLLGGGDMETLHDFHNRNLETSCNDDESEISIALRTDNYAYETQWKITNMEDSTILVKGPPAGTKYDDRSSYTGKWCVPNGSSYKVVVSDAKADGMCSKGTSISRSGEGSDTGCGYFKVYLNGVTAGMIVQDKSAWTTKQFLIDAVPANSRIAAATEEDEEEGGGGGGWCNKVKSVQTISRGTCKLPDGSRGHSIRVSTTVDKYGSETSWKIVRNGSVQMKLGAIIPSMSTKAVEDCVSPGDYTFTINDLDGICCKHGTGHYEIIVDGDVLITGGSFINQESHTIKLGYDWIDSMDERDCEWWWAHNYRREDWHTRCTDHYCNKNARHLRWSSTLEADARDYAERLLETCETIGIEHDHTDQGENLAKNRGKPGTQWSTLYPADNVVKRFVDNEETRGWNGNAHLTQALWYDSRYVGCGESVATMSDGRICRMQVCRYAKAGNCMMESFQSEVGNRWMIPTFGDESACGPMCPPGGCHL